MSIDLGLTQEELREEVLSRATEKLVEFYVNDEAVTSAIERTIRESIDRVAKDVADAKVEPMVRERIEGVMLQKTNEWGESKGEPVTFVEYLVQRAEHYLVEPVDYKGKAKKDSRDWHHKNTQTRVTYLVDQHLQYSISTAMKAALANANDALAKGIADTVKLKLAEISESLKVEVKTK